MARAIRYFTRSRRKTNKGWVADTPMYPGCTLDEAKRIQCKNLELYGVMVRQGKMIGTEPPELWAEYDNGIEEQIRDDSPCPS